jgi:alkylated DNA repair protein alkB family protein 8
VKKTAKGAGATSGEPAAGTGAGAWHEGCPELVVSKNQEKREAKKAVKAAAKARYGKERSHVTSVDGSEIKKKQKERWCPPCPVHMLPAQDDEDDGNDATGSVENKDHEAMNREIGNTPVDDCNADAAVDTAVGTDAMRGGGGASAGVGVGAGAGLGGGPGAGIAAAVALAEALPSVERQHVQQVYNAIAQQWHGTRYRAWSGVEDFIARHVRTYPGSLVADVGCGNGKNVPEVEAAGGFALGTDFSVGLLDICGEQGLEVFAADAVCLPFRSGVFDAALNIAVLHHISSPGRRRKLVAETMRLLRPGGVALFYAWALEQESGGVSGHHFESQDVLVPFHKRAGRGFRGNACAGEGGRAAAEGHCADPVGDSDPDPAAPRVYHRYCHVYKEGELDLLFWHLRGWVKINAAYYDCGNWCVEAERTM